MRSSMLATVEILEPLCVPFSSIKLPAGTKLKGWYDGLGVNIFEEDTHTVRFIPIAHVKHRIVVGD